MQRMQGVAEFSQHSRNAGIGPYSDATATLGVMRIRKPQRPDGPKREHELRRRPCVKGDVGMRSLTTSAICGEPLLGFSS